MAVTNHERIGKALELLKNGLGPFVERESKLCPMKRPALSWTGLPAMPGGSGVGPG